MIGGALHSQFFFAVMSVYAFKTDQNGANLPAGRIRKSRGLPTVHSFLLEEKGHANENRPAKRDFEHLGVSLGSTERLASRSG